MARQHLQKHEREFRDEVRALGARDVVVIKGRRHPRIAGVAPNGHHFELPFSGSPGDRNWKDAGLRQVSRLFARA